MKPGQQTILGSFTVALVASLVASPAAVAAGTSNSVGDLQQILTSIVRNNIPHTYEDTSKWGLTAERWDGLHLRLDGLRLKTKRRKKTVNHGDWQRYRVSLVDPQEQFAVQLWNIHQRPDGRVGFESSVTARVHAFGRTSRWVRGVQLYSFGVDADASVTLYTSGSVGLKFDVTKAPPDVLFDAQVSRAELRLQQFELDRLSNIRGDAAEQLGQSVHGILDRMIAERNGDLAVKINEEIAKNKDDLRLSLHDLLASKWAKFVESTSSKTQDGQE